MSRPTSHKQPAVPVQRPKQPNASGTAPSTISEFHTQLPVNAAEWSQPDDLSPSIISDSQPRASRQRHISASGGPRKAASTSAPSSHRSEERTEQAEDSRQRQPSHNLPIPQALPGDPSSRSPHNEDEGKRAAAEHSSSLDDAPLGVVIAAQHDLLDSLTKGKGLSPELVLRGVVQATNRYFPDLEWDQTEPTLSQRGSKPSQDAASGVVTNREGASSIITGPGGDDLIEQVAAVPAKKKGKRRAALKLAVGHLKIEINSEKEFRDMFLSWQLDAIGAGGLVIDLLELAKQTVQDVEPKFQQRLGDAEEQERQRKRQRVETRAQGKRKNPTRRANITEEIWQVLYTIIANMFVFGLKPLFKTVDAASHSPYNTAGGSTSDEPPATGSSTDSNERNSRNGGTSSNRVAAFLGEAIKKNMKELRESLDEWWRIDDKSQQQMDKLHVYHHKLETVRLFDGLMKTWKEDESIRRRLREERGYGDQDAAIIMLSCMLDQDTGSNNELKVFPENSPYIQKILGMIDGFRPICSLVDAFGKGVLLLLIRNAESHVQGTKGEGQEHYPQHERIRDVALSLCNVDSEKYGGKLREQFTKLDKILRRVLQIRGGGNTGGLLLDCPQWSSFVKTDVGKRIQYILKCIDTRNDVDSGRWNEDEGSRHNGSTSVADTGDGISSA